MGLINKVLKPVKNTVQGVETLMGRGPAANSMAMRSPAGQATKLAAKMAYQSSPLGAYMQFATNPSVKNLLMAGMSFTPGGATAGVAMSPRALGMALRLPKDAQGLKLAAAIGRQADSHIIPFSGDIRQALEKIVPDVQGGYLTGKSGIVKVPAKSQHGEFVTNRTAIIQDPISGRMFMAPGALHGDVVKYVQHHFPEFKDRDVLGWLQHEVYAPEHFGPGLDPAPARLMFQLNNKDTKIATIARARLIQQMAKAGIRQDVGLAKWLESRNAAARRRT